MDGKIKDCHTGFIADPAHILGNLLGLLTARHYLPFSMCESDEWRLFTHHMPVPGSSLLRKDCIRKSIIEKYVYVRNKIKLEF